MSFLLLQSVLKLPLKDEKQITCLETNLSITKAITTSLKIVPLFINIASTYIKIVYLTKEVLPKICKTVYSSPPHRIIFDAKKKSCV